MSGSAVLPLTSHGFISVRTLQGILISSSSLIPWGKTPRRKVEWKFSSNSLWLKNSGFVYQKQGEKPTEYRVDDMNLRIDQFGVYPDSLFMTVSSFTLIDSKGFYLNDLSADLKSTRGKLTITNLTFETLNSEVDSAEFTYEREELPGGDGKRVMMGLKLDKALLNLADAALFVPGMKGMNQELEITGYLSGNPAKPQSQRSDNQNRGVYHGRL